MKYKQLLYITYLIGCVLLSISSKLIWGWNGVIFVIGLVIVTNPLIHKEMI